MTCPTGGTELFRSGGGIQSSVLQPLSSLSLGLTVPRDVTHDGEVGRGSGISRERANSMERAPLPNPLPARASRGEGAEDFRDGRCIKMRPTGADSELSDGACSASFSTCQGVMACNSDQHRPVSVARRTPNAGAAHQVP